MQWEEWIAEVEDRVCDYGDIAWHDVYRMYFDEGMTPQEAVEHRNHS